MKDCGTGLVTMHGLAAMDTGSGWTFVRQGPVTIDPRLILGAAYWNRVAGWGLFIVTDQAPVVRWRESVEGDLQNYGGLTWGGDTPVPEIWINPTLRAHEAVISHEVGHALGFGHKVADVGGDPRITPPGGVMGGEECRDPDYDRELLRRAGYRVVDTAPPLPQSPPPSETPRERRARERAIRRAERAARRAARRAGR